jgi:glyoxylase-like metal-dependent hydrolase (beta-lactamase superfamily II)
MTISPSSDRAAGTASNDATTPLQYPCGDPPAPGEAREVAPGVLWLRMPLPFALNHINLWALDDGEGWAIVDSGTKTPEVLAAWQSLLAPDGALGGRPVTRVIATHMHPDHMGMAGWLTRKFNARLWMTREEYLMCRTLTADTGREAPDDAIRFFQRCGWSEEALDVYRARFGGFGKFIHALPDSLRRMVDGESLHIGKDTWRVVVGRGHSPEHACLVCDERRLMISGDQVLPRISSNVSVHPTEPDADPLGDWLASIAHLRSTLHEDLLVLPSHGEPFLGVHVRLDRLAQGHAKPLRAIDCFGALFARSIDQHSEVLGLATGESLAHLNYLMLRGEIRCTPDEAGVLWYQLND